MPMVAAYARVSSEEQVKEGYSIASQLRAAGLYVELHGLGGEVQEYVEPGLSGRDTERPQFQRLLRDIRAGQVGHVVVWRLSRLHRNLRDFLETLAVLEDRQVALHSITEHVDTKSATGRLLVNILMAFHAFESEKLAEDVRSGMAQKIRSGGWTNHAPVGYHMEQGALLSDERAVPVLAAFRRAAEGAGLRELAEFLDMSPAGVSYLLTNPVYAGYVFEHRSRLPPHPRLCVRLEGSPGVYPGDHKALVDPDLWDRVQLVRRQMSHETSGSRHLLAGILRCGGCGGSVEFSYMNNGRNYRCAGSGRRRRRCHQVSALKVEATLLVYLNDLQHDPALLQEIETELNRRVCQVTQETEAPLVEAQHELKAQRQQEERWRRLFIEGKITEEKYLEEAPNLEDRIAYWDERATVLATGPRMAEEELAAYREQADLFLRAPFVVDLWDVWTETERAVLLHELLETVLMEKEHLVVKGFGLPAARMQYIETRGLRRQIPGDGPLTTTIVCRSLKPERGVGRRTYLFRAPPNTTQAPGGMGPESSRAATSWRRRSAS